MSWRGETFVRQANRGEVAPNRANRTSDAHCLAESYYRPLVTQKASAFFSVDTTPRTR